MNDLEHSSLYSEDLARVPPSEHTSRMYRYAVILGLWFIQGHASSATAQAGWDPVYLKVKQGGSGWVALEDSTRMGQYGRIGNAIYCGEIACNARPMEEADADSFMVYAGTDYAKDRHHAYYPCSMVCVDYADCGTCNCVGYVIEGVDLDTFEPLGPTPSELREPWNTFEDYAVDRSRAYNSGKAVPDVTPESFKQRLGLK